MPSQLEDFVERGQAAQAAVDELTLVLTGEWLTLEEAVKALGRSATTLERLVASGKIRSQLQPVPGRKSMRVYYAEDVRGLAPSESPQPLRAHHKAGAPIQVQLPSELIDLAKQVLEDRRALLPAASEEEQAVAAISAVPIPVKLWLSLDEAEAYSGLSKGFLIGRIDVGEIVGIKAGRNGSWRIARVSLERYAPRL